MSIDESLKIVLLGDVGVGKSCLMLRITDDAFSEAFEPEFLRTIGVDFRLRTILVGGRRVKLQVWEKAAQQRFATVTPALYRGADGVAIVYDTTQRASLEHARDWCAEARHHGRPGLHLLLVGTKADRAGADVGAAEADALAHELAIDCVAPRVSALTGEGVRDAIVMLVRACLLERHGAGAIPLRPDDGEWAPAPDWSLCVTM
jgi:small GTP-binding protein